VPLDQPERPDQTEVWPGRYERRTERSLQTVASSSLTCVVALHGSGQRGPGQVEVQADCTNSSGASAGSERPQRSSCRPHAEVSVAGAADQIHRHPTIMRRCDAGCALWRSQLADRRSGFKRRRSTRGASRPVAPRPGASPSRKCRPPRLRHVSTALRRGRRGVEAEPDFLAFAGLIHTPCVTKKIDEG
jgi:hypothetical protein